MEGSEGLEIPESAAEPRRPELRWDGPFSFTSPTGDRWGQVFFEGSGFGLDGKALFKIFPATTQPTNQVISIDNKGGYEILETSLPPIAREVSPYWRETPLERRNQEVINFPPYGNQRGEQVVVRIEPEGLMATACVGGLFEGLFDSEISKRTIRVGRNPQDDKIGILPDYVEVSLYHLCRITACYPFKGGDLSSVVAIAIEKTRREKNKLLVVQDGQTHFAVNLPPEIGIRNIREVFPAGNGRYIVVGEGSRNQLVWIEVEASKKVQELPIDENGKRLLGIRRIPLESEAVGLGWGGKEVYLRRNNGLVKLMDLSDKIVGEPALHIIDDNYCLIAVATGDEKIKLCLISINEGKVIEEKDFPFKLFSDESRGINLQMMFVPHGFSDEGEIATYLLAANPYFPGGGAKGSNVGVFFLPVTVSF